MFFFGMWHAMHDVPADPVWWCECCATAASVAYCGWQVVHVLLPAGVASAASFSGASSVCGSWQVVHVICEAQPPSWKSRPSPEFVVLPPGFLLRSPPSQVHG